MFDTNTQERFWSKVDKTAGEDACWIWTATENGNGYRQFWLNGRFEGSHRVSYKMDTGQKIHPDAMVCHSCDNRRCVNPKHLWIGSGKDNMQDMVQKGRHAEQKKDTCPRGHLYDAVTARGARRCTTCDRKLRAISQRVIIDLKEDLLKCEVALAWLLENLTDEIAICKIKEALDRPERSYAFSLNEGQISPSEKLALFND